MLTRSLENGVFSVTANRIGSDIRPHGTLAFTGGSQVVTPKGERVHGAAPDREDLFVTELDMGLARNKMMTARNHLFEDRRPPFYASLCKKKAIIEGD